MRTWLLVGLLLAAACGAHAAPVSPAEARPWLRHVIPLPQQIAFEGFVKARPAEVAVRLSAGATDVVRAAAGLLTRALGNTQP
jgi:hypothetical protein